LCITYTLFKGWTIIEVIDFAPTKEGKKLWIWGLPTCEPTSASSQSHNQQHAHAKAGRGIHALISLFQLKKYSMSALTRRS
jgi:hypothetical protein